MAADFKGIGHVRHVLGVQQSLLTVLEGTARTEQDRTKPPTQIRAKRLAMALRAVKEAVGELDAALKAHEETLCLACAGVGFIVVHGKKYPCDHGVAPPPEAA